MDKSKNQIKYFRTQDGNVPKVFNKAGFLHISRSKETMKDWHSITALAILICGIVALVVTGHGQSDYIMPLYTMLGVVGGAKIGSKIPKNGSKS